MPPDDPLAILLGEARRRAADSQEEQVRRVAATCAHSERVVVESLEKVADRLEIRITRSLSICRYLKNELDAGRVPILRSAFETDRQDYTDAPETIAGIVIFREEREGSVFGAESAFLEIEDRPKYGFACFEGTPTEPFPFGPVCFVLNLERADLRERITLTPIDSSIPGLAPEEVGTLDHPLNALARSSDALHAAGLLLGARPSGCGIHDNAREGTPEAQVWGPLRLTPEQVSVIIVEVASVNDPELADLRQVAEHQEILLLVRVLKGAG